MATRQALLDAARKIMAEKGLEGATIMEITEAADVANGSFYNNFASKEEIMEAVAVETMTRLGERVDASIRDIEDPAEAFAMAHRQAFEFGNENPDIGLFVIRNSLSSSILEQSIFERVERDLSNGLAAGRFSFGDVRLAARAVVGALNAVSAEVLDGSLDESAIDETLFIILSMVGVAEKDARRISGFSL